MSGVPQHEEGACPGLHQLGYRPLVCGNLTSSADYIQGVKANLGFRNKERPLTCHRVCCRLLTDCGGLPAGRTGESGQLRS